MASRGIVTAVLSAALTLATTQAAFSQTGNTSSAGSGSRMGQTTTGTSGTRTVRQTGTATSKLSAADQQMLNGRMGGLSTTERQTLQRMSVAERRLLIKMMRAGGGMSGGNMNMNGSRGTSGTTGGASTTSTGTGSGGTGTGGSTAGNGTGGRGTGTGSTGTVGTGGGSGGTGTTPR